MQQSPLIGLERYEDAYALFSERLYITIIMINMRQQAIESIEMLFPNGLEQTPRLNNMDNQVNAIFRIRYELSFLWTATNRAAFI
jgi:hypothetical protein